MGELSNYLITLNLSDIVRRENLESFKSAQLKINGLKDEVLADESKSLVRVTAAQSHKTRDQEMMEQKLMRIIFRAIADNSGFLIESKLKHLLMPYTRTEQTLVNLDAVFSALGIHQSEEIDYIKNYFVPFTRCKKCNKNPFAEGYPDEIPIECLGEDHDLQLTTLNVYKALVEFTKDHSTSLDKMM